MVPPATADAVCGRVRVTRRPRSPNRFADVTLRHATRKRIAPTPVERDVDRVPRRPPQTSHCPGPAARGIFALRLPFSAPGRGWSVAVTVRQLAELVGAEVVGDPDLTVVAARPVREAKPGD